MTRTSFIHTTGNILPGLQRLDSPEFTVIDITDSQEARKKRYRCSTCGSLEHTRNWCDNTGLDR